MIIITISTLKKVIDSIWGPRWPIFWTFALLIGLIFMASFFYFYVFFEDFDTEVCNDLYVCFFAFIDSTWKGGEWALVTYDYSGTKPWHFG